MMDSDSRDRLRRAICALGTTAAIAAALLAGCGIKGPLKLPAAQGSAQPPTTLGAPASPGTQSTPAPEAMPAEPPATSTQPAEPRKP